MKIFSNSNNSMQSILKCMVLRVSIFTLCFLSYCLVANSYLTLLQPRGLSPQAPLSMRFPRQEYWYGLPFPSPGDLPDQGLNPHLLH